MTELNDTDLEHVAAGLTKQSSACLASCAASCAARCFTTQAAANRAVNQAARDLGK